MTWFRPQFSAVDVNALRYVVDSGFVNDGPVTEFFEKVVAQYVGSRHAVAVTSGTSAIALSLMAAGLEPGSEVVVPDLTFVATANAVRLAGLTPVLADVDPYRFCLTVADVEAATTPRTAAVVAVEVNGRAPDYGELAGHCARKKLVLVTDSCEALGSSYLGKMLGTHGLAGCLSFSPNKIITTGQGGMVLTDSDALAGRVRELKDQGRATRGTGGDDLHPTVGYNFKFTDLQAAVGLAQLQTIGDRVAAAQARNKIYEELLGDVVEVPPTVDGELRLWFDALTDKRDQLSGLASTRNFWLPLHEQVPYRTEKRFPCAERASRLGVWLPSSLDMSGDDVEKICDNIRTKCFGRIPLPSRAA